MTGPDLARAGERLRRQIESLGELRNAGARDQRFKVWRQDTLTLLQRLWPGDHVKAEGFRRIPFSAPAARTERGGAREYFERGCKEAEVYLERLAFELGAQGGPPVMNPQDDAPEVEAPGSAWTGSEAGAPAAETSGPMIPSVPAPQASATPTRVEQPETPPAVPEPRAAEPLPPPPPRKPITFKPASSAYETLPISFLGPDRRKTQQPPEAGVPSRRRDDAPPPAAAGPMPAREPAATMPAREPAATMLPPVAPAAGGAPATPPAPVDGAATEMPQPKMRLKDMLGFGDTPPAGIEPVTPHSPAPPEMFASGASVEVPMAPVRGTTPEAGPEDRPGDAHQPPRDYAAEFILDSPVLQSQAHPLRHRVRAEEAAATEPPPASPHASMSAAPARDASPPPPLPEVIPMPARDPEAAFVPGPEMDSEAELPPQLAAEEIYELATRVLEFGVSPAHAAILRAALIDLARQLENPPIHWGALRETIAFAMDYPELARRLLPRLLPYLSQAA